MLFPSKVYTNYVCGRLCVCIKQAYLHNKILTFIFGVLKRNSVFQCKIWDESGLLDITIQDILKCGCKPTIMLWDYFIIFKQI